MLLQSAEIHKQLVKVLFLDPTATILDPYLKVDILLFLFYWPFLLVVIDRFQQICWLDLVETLASMTLRLIHEASPSIVGLSQLTILLRNGLFVLGYELGVFEHCQYCDGPILRSELQGIR